VETGDRAGRSVASAGLFLAQISILIPGRAGKI
jgi:hypothetical protein